jgi:ADP-ribosylglycohydrolase
VGVYYGVNDIPQHWRERVADGNMIIDIATKIYHQDL